MDEIGCCRMELDSDIDLESGGTRDAKKGQALSDEKSKISSKIMSSESSYAGDYSSPSSVDEIHYKNKEERLRVGVANYNVDKKRVMKPSAARPPRPHRPPKDAASLSPYDVKLLKEMYELNSNCKRMGSMRTFNKMKRHKGPSLKSNLLACIVTIIFFAVIILQGNNHAFL
ncbi:hypothetical protein ACS0TY_005589 [Phlomoides rotata]